MHLYTNSYVFKICTISFSGELVENEFVTSACLMLQKPSGAEP